MYVRSRRNVSGFRKKSTSLAMTIRWFRFRWWNQWTPPFDRPNSPLTSRDDAFTLPVSSSNWLLATLSAKGRNYLATQTWRAYVGSRCPNYLSNLSAPVPSKSPLEFCRRLRAPPSLNVQDQLAVNEKRMGAKSGCLRYVARLA